jgi:hypothetical protein
MKVGHCPNCVCVTDDFMVSGCWVGSVLTWVINGGGGWRLDELHSPALAHNARRLKLGSLVAASASGKAGNPGNPGKFTIDE